MQYSPALLAEYVRSRCILFLIFPRVLAQMDIEGSGSIEASDLVGQADRHVRILHRRYSLL